MTASTEVKIYSKASRVYKAIAEEILKITTNSPQSRFDIGLSGGNTPKELFHVLQKEYKTAIQWKRIHFWWGDERCVPPTDNDSNYKWANDILFSKINIPDKNIHRINGELIPEDEAVRYTHEIEANLNYRGNCPVFDLLILGLGDDGHTASIFPDQMELFEDERICAVARHPVTGKRRITLTGRTINNASHIFFLVLGESKSMRISEIMNDDEAAKLLPAYYISPGNGVLTWFLDEQAGARIS